MILLSLAFALSGLGALGLSQPQHHSWARGRTPSPQDGRTLCAAGWGLLAASLAASLVAWGAARGLVGWCGVLTLAAAALVLLRTYARPPKRR